MTISETRALELLHGRDAAFIHSDIEAYLALWEPEGTIEFGAHRFVGAEAMRQAIVAAWNVSRALHMETRAYAIHGSSILNEFVIVWEDRKTEARTVAAGMGVLEVGERGRFTLLRDFIETTGAPRPSALELPAVRRLLGGAG